MEDDIVVLIGNSLEQVRALAEGKYDILYERQFDTIDTESADDVWGMVSGSNSGAVAIAKWL